MTWKDIVKVDPSRFRRYLQNQPNRGKDTSTKSNKCDKCGTRVAVRNTNKSKRGSHIKLCNHCKNKEE
jgi:predicted SprT family Zn-dependent metalloprotease|tara:strand:+ start:7186 stop:7389 length:204 start_codon:yes stop_codon:yes gene_type:complete